MKNNTFRLLLIVAILSVSCSSPRFYNEIKSTYPAYKEGKRHFNKDANKTILRRLSNRLQHTQHIIYFEAQKPSLDLNDNNFDIVVFNIQKNEYYSLSHYNGRLIEHVIPKLEYFNFVYGFFKNDDCTKLIEYGEKSGQSGIRVHHSIYDINLVDNAVKECTFLDIILIDGKP